MNDNILRYEIIKQAVNKNDEAIKLIISHYEQYINKLSTITVNAYHKKNNYMIDTELRGELIGKLISAILDFKL